jgi:hypothetical protein
MRLAMDTNSVSVLMTQGAKRAGLNPVAPESALHEKMGLAWLAESAPLEIGTQTFTAHFEVYPAIQTPANSYGVDGLLGWQAVRDNILLFNSQQHTISRLDKLPVEVAAWLKFKIHPGELLAIEVPLADGQTGNLLMDTGSNIDGIAMPQDQYQHWRSTHVGAKVYPLRYFTNGALTKSSERAWANEVSVGPLILTDLPVRPANDDETSWVNHFAGKLGMYAFERMNVILDYSGGYAYLQPKPPPGPPYPIFHYSGDNGEPFLSYDWQVADSVKVNLAVLNAQSGKYKAFWKDYVGGIADYDRAIDLAPNCAEYYVARGVAREGKGDLDGARADYIQACNLAPENTDAKSKRAHSSKRGPSSGEAGVWPPL